jgi:4,5-dihydroxyphthalate decarboxylase
MLQPMSLGAGPGACQGSSDAVQRRQDRGDLAVREQGQAQVGKLHVSLSCGDYDRTRFLIDGAVDVEGVELTVIPLSPSERHSRFLDHAEFDACELNIGIYFAWKALGAPFTAIPVFPYRKFCHEIVSINRSAGITQPEDLSGKTIGVLNHLSPAAIWMRGVLQDAYGVSPRSLKIRANGAEPVPGWTAPPWLDLQRVPAGRTADDMLVAGELDACILPEVAPSVRAGHPSVCRLWPNYRQEEAEYFRRTGIFPIGHTVVIRDQALDRDPWIAVSLMKAIADAKKRGISHWSSDPRRSFLAWYGAELEEQRTLMGADPWPYGLEANRVALETMLRYAEEQGIIPRRLDLEELFVESTRDASGFLD